MRIAVLGRNLSGIQSGALVAHMETAAALAARGHAVRYAALKGDSLSRFGDPVEVGRAAVQDAAKWCDVVFVRDEIRIQRVIDLARGRRIVYVAHSPAGAPNALGLRLPAGTRVVWASSAAKEAAERLGGTQPGVVIEGYPIRFVRTEPGACITLVNLSERKGGRLFWELAERMPERPFLGVLSWDEQVVPSKVPPNVTLIDRQADTRAVYGQTRILLVPSADPGTIAANLLPTWGEAWNRVSVEAAACGIPVIAHPSGGVLASIGHAATYVDRGDVDGWVEAICALDEPLRMAEAKGRCAARIAEIEGDRESIIDAYEDVLAGRMAVPR